MNKEDLKQKASLSWNQEDYQIMQEEMPACLSFGNTEGEAMTKEGVEDWVRQAVQYLSVFKEDYPDKFREQYQYFLLDLEYLYSLGKISKEDYDRLKKEKVFNFGQE